MNHSSQVQHCAILFGIWPGRIAALSVLLATVAETAIAGKHIVQQARKATADVIRVGDQWNISVEFVQTAAFGKSRSELDNQRLARDYALRGLARELGAESGRTIAVSRMQVEHSGPENGFWKARFTIPVDGVSECIETLENTGEATDDAKNDSQEEEVAAVSTDAVPDSKPTVPVDFCTDSPVSPLVPDISPPLVLITPPELPTTPQLPSVADAVKPLTIPPLPQMSTTVSPIPSEQTP